MFNKEFTDLIENQFEVYKRHYTRLYDQVLTDFNILNEQSIDDFRDSIMYHILLNSDIDGDTVEDIYYSCYKCFDQEEGFMLEIELDYLFDNLTYDNVRHSMKNVCDQLN